MKEAMDAAIPRHLVYLSGVIFCSISKKAITERRGKDQANSIFYTEIYHETRNMICDLATNLLT